MSLNLFIDFDDMGFEESKTYASALRDYLLKQAACAGIELPIRPETANPGTLRLTVYVGGHARAVRGWVNDWLTENPAATIDVTDSDARPAQPRPLPDTQRTQTPIRLPDVDFKTELFRIDPNKKKW
jgi:hypothetical protein